MFNCTGDRDPKLLLKPLSVSSRRTCLHIFSAHSIKSRFVVVVVAVVVVVPLLIMSTLNTRTSY